MTKTFIKLALILLLLSQLLSAQNQMQPFPTDWEKLADAEFDLSFLLEKPAGKNGFITSEGGHFIQPNGERFRVWGVNLTGGACFPEKEDAPKVAKFLAAMGINAVRFHFLDSNWGPEKSIFDASKNHTRSFHPEQIDKLDYFVAELKKEGVYSNFNLNVGRTFREGDEVPYYEYLGIAKGATLFDHQIINLQREYAYQLLTHTNPYTDSEYRNEPALAFIEIVNENSLVEAWFSGRLNGDQNSKQTSTWSGIPEYYAQTLTHMYNDWLVRALRPEQIAEIRMEVGIDDQTPIPRLRNDEFAAASDLRFQTEAKFIIYTENAFYYGMYKYLKETVQTQQLIAANSDHNHYKNGYALLSSTSKLDFVDGHVYWQHPNYFTDSVSGKNSFKIENTPMVSNPGWSTVAQLSRSAVKDLPFTVSEINHPYPNQYAGEGFLTLGAYALFQDWDGIYFYTLEHDDPSNWKSKKPSYFDLVHDPVKMAGIVGGALLFHRRDVKAAQEEIIRFISTKDVVEGIRQSPELRPFFHENFNPLTPLQNKTRLVFSSFEKNNFEQKETPETISSDTSELLWEVKDNKGLVQINTPNSQAIIGHPKNTVQIECKNLKADLKNNFASIAVISLDGKSISESSKLLLTASASSLLTGAQFNADKTSLEEWGTLPFTIEPVVGKVTLNNLTKLDAPKIFALDGGGQIIHEIKPKQLNEKLSFKIGKTPTVWYLVTK